MDLVDFLRSVPTFAEFSQADLLVLERSFRVDSYPPGHTLLQEGKKGNALYVLMEGEVEVTRRHPVLPKIEKLGSINAGEVFGLQSLIDDKPRITTCRTATNVTVASLPKVAFKLLYSSSLILAERFQYIIARHLVHELRDFDESLKSAHAEGSIESLYNSMAQN